MVLNLLSLIFLKHYHQATEIEMKEMIQRHFDRLMTREELVSKFDNVDKKFDSVDKRIESLETIILGQNQPKPKQKKTVPPPPPPVDSSQEIQIAVTILGCFSTTRMGPVYILPRRDSRADFVIRIDIFKKALKRLKIDISAPNLSKVLLGLGFKSVESGFYSSHRQNNLAFIISKLKKGMLWMGDLDRICGRMEALFKDTSSEIIESCLDACTVFEDKRFFRFKANMVEILEDEENPRMLPTGMSCTEILETKVNFIQKLLALFGENEYVEGQHIEFALQLGDMSRPFEECLVKFVKDNKAVQDRQKKRKSKTYSEVSEEQSGGEEDKQDEKEEEEENPPKKKKTGIAKKRRVDEVLEDKRIEEIVNKTPDVVFSDDEELEEPLSQRDDEQMPSKVSSSSSSSSWDPDNSKVLKKYSQIRMI